MNREVPFRAPGGDRRGRTGPMPAGGIRSVSPHRIRLRGAWECQSLEEPETGTQRLTLPTSWPSDRPRRWRLTRGFHRPPLDPGSHLRLVLEQGPGIQYLLLIEQCQVTCSPQVL